MGEVGILIGSAFSSEKSSARASALTPRNVIDGAAVSGIGADSHVAADFERGSETDAAK